MSSSITDFKRTRISFHRPITSYTKAQAGIGWLYRRFHRVVNADRVRSLRYLNFGCGPNLLSDFVNLDFDWRPAIDICCDIRYGLPLPSQSLDGIFTEHCLEHITFDDCRNVLKECRRVMTPGGTLRVIVPNAELFASLYLQARNGEDVHFPYERDYPAHTPMMHVNRVFRDHGHLFAYDGATLSMLLGEAGFTDVAQCRFREGRDPKLLVDTEARAVESLYVEASV